MHYCYVVKTEAVKALLVVCSALGFLLKILFLLECFYSWLKINICKPILAELCFLEIITNTVTMS